MKESNVEGALINQLLRASTSIGANIYEAQYAQGTKDFISKLEIALKECNESKYWLDLLCETESISKEEYNQFQKKCIDIQRMLVASIVKSKEKL